jgi:hypothetical protein
MRGQNLLAYDIGRLERNPDYSEVELAAGLERAPERRRASEALNDIVLAMLAVPGLHESCELDGVELYLGRAGATPKHVLGRLKAQRDHKHGMVVLTCATDDVEGFEGDIVKVLTCLSSYRRLRLKNASANGQGRLPDVAKSCLYLTWRTTAKREMLPRDRHILEVVASDAATKTKIKRDQILLGLEPLTKARQAVAGVEWHRMHAGD